MVKKMVNIEEISMELTKPAKHLAEWDYPFSETLEAYFSLFNDTSNKGFSKAGLVLQNSTAVYVHRIDWLWNKTEMIRDVFINSTQETEKKKLSKKRDKYHINFEDFGTIDFAEEVDRNIDIKKNNVQETVKSKTRCFTQLEKSIAQHTPIDIYDVNGEIIGKKYDFRCNQDISMNGVLIDEFAPEDFNCIDDFAQEKSATPSSRCSRVASSEHLSNTTAHDTSDKNISSDEEFERNDNDSPEETSDLIDSLHSSKNLSSSPDSIDDTLQGSTTDNREDQSSLDAANESQCTSVSDTNLPSNTFDSTMLSNNSDVQSSNNNTGTNVQDGNDQMDSTIKTLSTSLEDMSKDAELSESSLQTTCISQEDLELICLKYIQEYNSLQHDSVTNVASELLGFRTVETCSTCDDTYDTCESVTLTETENMDFIEHYSRPPTASSLTSRASSKNKSQSRRKRTPKTLKKGRIAKKCLTKESVTKNLLNELQKGKRKKCISMGSLFSEADRLSISQDINASMKYIREYDPVQYDHTTDAASNFLGFRLRVVEACDSMCDVAEDDDAMMISEDHDDDMLGLHCNFSTPCSPMCSEPEDFRDLWLRPDSPDFLPKHIEKWHELLQPKLLNAEQRSKFSIRDYKSRMIERLRTSTQRRLSFDEAVPKEDASEVARYFLASLDLAAKQKIDLIRCTDPEASVEIVLNEEDIQEDTCDDQADSHD